jgi:hypothetical protein
MSTAFLMLEIVTLEKKTWSSSCIFALRCAGKVKLIELKIILHTGITSSSLFFICSMRCRTLSRLFRRKVAEYTMEENHLS